jgi:hypothetical protein
MRRACATASSAAWAGPCEGRSAAAVGVVGAGRRRLAVALEEPVDVRREQLAVARRHAQRAVRGAEVDRAEQREQPAVRAEPARHGVGEGAGVGAEVRIAIGGGEGGVGARAARAGGRALEAGEQEVQRLEHLIG